MTEIVFILDRSGSMANLVGDTIGGFNSMLNKQRQEAGEALVTTVLFDTEVETIHDRMPIGQVPDLTTREYYVRGCTALLDAVGDTAEKIMTIQKYARPQDKPEKTLFVITTDGLENASRRWNYDRVKALIERQKEAGWEFIFLGANIDAAREAARFGIAQDRAVTYKADHMGTALNFSVISEAVSQVRACPSAPLASSWKAKIEEDVKKRGR